MTDGPPLLSVRDLTKHYPITEGVLSREVGAVRAVDGISFDLYRGETLGLVGESGCGKSTAATSIIRLEEPTGGAVIFNGRERDPVREPTDGPHPNDVTAFDDEELTSFRRQAQMIFQDPSSSLDPRMTIGETIGEPLRVHGFGDRAARRRVVENLLERVGMSAGDVHRFPHEFSGGQKQRISLARALVTNPELIVADEPVSALDVSIQAEILSLINEIQEAFELSILFISHDMGVIREVSDRVAVMYLGEIVEIGPTEELFDDPQHPYTEALLSAIPTPDPRTRERGIQLSGDVPSPADPPAGCRFHTRCHRIIQPERHDLDQAAWRGIMNLRERVSRRNVDVDAAREFVATERGLDSPEAVADDDVARAIRDEFGIPASVSDPDAEAALSTAIAAVLDGDLEGADDLLADEFATVCGRERPALRETDAGHPAACHLHDRTETADALHSASAED